VVKGCLQELESVEIYRIRVHPQDAPALVAYFQQHQRGNLEVIADAQVTRGGALLETAQGQLDARLETQLVEITHGLADR
jgi:flagellar biosynthesis/type III secretory pathway protein FliH